MIINLVTIPRLLYWPVQTTSTYLFEFFYNIDNGIW